MTHGRLLDLSLLDEVCGGDRYMNPRENGGAPFDVYTGPTDSMPSLAGAYLSAGYSWGGQGTTYSVGFDGSRLRLYQTEFTTEPADPRNPNQESPGWGAATPGIQGGAGLCFANPGESMRSVMDGTSSHGGVSVGPGGFEISANNAGGCIGPTAGWGPTPLGFTLGQSKTTEIPIDTPVAPQASGAPIDMLVHQESPAASTPFNTPPPATAAPATPGAELLNTGAPIEMYSPSMSPQPAQPTEPEQARQPAEPEQPAQPAEPPATAAPTGAGNDDSTDDNEAEQ